METYEKTLKQITTSKKYKVGNNSTYTSQLDRIAHDILPPNKYQGAYPYDRIPKLNSTHCCIVNLDSSQEQGSHWCSIYRSGNTLICYDSFGRHPKKILPNMKIRKNLKIVNTDPDVEQHEEEANCGQRCLSFLKAVYTDGLPAAMKI